MSLVQIEEQTLLPSLSRSVASYTSADLDNLAGASTLIVILDVTGIAGSPSLTLAINAKDTASGKYYNLLTGTAVTTVSTNRYRISPNLTASANAIAQDFLPRYFQITVANSGGAGIYSVGYNLVR